MSSADSEHSSPTSQSQHATHTTPSKRRVIEINCDICKRVHAKHRCPLQGIKPPTPAMYPGACAVCQHDFVLVRNVDDPEEATKISIFGDMGWMCCPCLVKILAPTNDEDLRTDEERLDCLIGEFTPKPVAEFVKECQIGEYKEKRAHLTEAAPGAGKSLALTMRAKFYGPRRNMNLVFNNSAAKMLRDRGAVNSHTYGSLGQRALRTHIVKGIHEKRRKDVYTSTQAPKDLTLTLVTTSKSKILLHTLYPPEQAGVGATSILYQVNADFCAELYSLTLQRAWGLYDTPAFDDIHSLLALATTKKIDVTLLEEAYTHLKPAAQATWSAMCDGNTSEARLLYACALIKPLHEASMETLQEPVWTPGSTGTPRTTICGPGVYDMTIRLPCNSYDEQVNGCLLLNLSTCVGKYALICGDELQDGSEARLRFTMLTIQSSDKNHGCPGLTAFHGFGDSNQSINGWNGGHQSAFARTMELLEDHLAAIANAAPSSSSSTTAHLITIDNAAPSSSTPTITVTPIVLTSTLPCSQRCPKAIVDFANETFDTAWLTYAKLVPDDLKPSETSAKMVASDSAIDGTIEFSCDFMRNPLDQFTSTGADVLIIARRGLDLSLLYDALVARGVACCLEINGKEVTPFDAMINTFDALSAQLTHLQLPLTVPMLLDLISADGTVAAANLSGIPRSNAKGLRALALRKQLMTGPTVVPLSAFYNFIHDELTSTKCRLVRLVTAHSSKGEEAYAVYILQPNDFPLDRAIKDENTLAQEPKVEYVAYTRASNSLFFLKHVSGGDDEDGNMDLMLFPPPFSSAVE